MATGMAANPNGGGNQIRKQQFRIERGGEVMRNRLAFRDVADRSSVLAAKGSSRGVASIAGTRCIAVPSPDAFRPS